MTDEGNLLMGIRIEVGSGEEKPKAPVDKSADSSRKIEIRVGKGLDTSSPSKPAAPASGDALKTTDAEKAEEKCDTCGGNYRQADGRVGPRSYDIKTKTMRRKCSPCNDKTKPTKPKSVRDAKPIVIKTKDS